MQKSKLAVLVSGSGTNLQAIINATDCKGGVTTPLRNVEIAIVISNKKDAYALQRAEKEGIKSLFINPKDFPNSIEYDKKLIELIKEQKIDLIILAGYLRILSKEFIKAFPNKIINIHPALLPKFGGKGMYGEKVHEAVLKEKEKESGCTVHFVDNGVDTGQIIAQKKISVLEGDNVETLQKRILIEEHKLLVESIKRILTPSII